MTVQAWLPVDVAGREAVHKTIGRAISDWSSQWFARSQVIVSQFRAVLHEPAAEMGAEWTVHRELVAISCSARAAARLVGWALDVDPAQLATRKADRPLLRLFEQALIGDLAHKIERAAGMEPVEQGQARPRKLGEPFGRLGGAVVELADEVGASLCRLAVPLEVVLPLCRSPTEPRSKKPPMGKFVHALGAADLTVEASLGVAEVPVADLRALAPGDVLVLKRGVADPIDISLSGSTAPFAQAKLIDFEGEMILALQAL